MDPNGIFSPDEADARLLANVHPRDWKNPRPAPRYNLLVLGAGTGGLVAALGAAGLGAKVALVERGAMGGDCLNTGCVPSKSLLASARAAAALRRAHAFGLRPVPAEEPDFPAVMRRMRELRARLSWNDSVARCHGLGVNVFLGEGRFTGPHELEVAGERLRFQAAVIATGSRPLVPDLPGLAESGFVTNETVFALAALPRRLAVIGAGPQGCELAQAFQRFGSQVSLFHLNGRILDREDQDAADVLQSRFLLEGIQLHLQAGQLRVENRGAEKIVHAERPGDSPAMAADEILLAAGRSPNVEGLGLEAAGVQSGPNGVEVDDTLRTTQRHIFAVGDVSSPYRFTHAADAQARLAVRNALFRGRQSARRLLIPWCTYTDPEIAHVGWSEQAAKRQGAAVRTYRLPLSEVDRAVLEGEEEGFVKVHVLRNRILGATIVAAHAGEMISLITLAMQHKIGFEALGQMVFPYPTQSEGVRQAALDHARRHLTPARKKFLAGFFRWRR